MLRGGSFASVSWDATSLPDDAEEWEAFLSLDGGRYYAFRITPHLRIGLRRFDFVVPNVDASDARILIRTGNERRETLIELPSRFSIERDARAELPLAIGLTPRRGEAARDGDPAVVGWAEGDRGGTRVAEQSGGREPAPHLRGAIDKGSTPSPITAPKHFRARAGAGDLARLDRVTRRLILYAAQQPPPVDLLLVCRRRNI